jgi:hypothetical protein
LHRFKTGGSINIEDCFQDSTRDRFYETRGKVENWNRAREPRFSQKVKNRTTLVSNPTCKEEPIIYTSSSQAMTSS